MVGGWLDGEAFCQRQGDSVASPQKVRAAESHVVSYIKVYHRKYVVTRPAGKSMRHVMAKLFPEPTRLQGGSFNF